ncbi:sensor histidine kinase [Brevibacterium linens]|uniref:Sensor histidine kinase regulating citrate/malate metabolism n=1 Tax=Brevibacterium linens ATCC 9172 TaxID=1255617 RepID=A0A2H1JDS6_BRELN|nr:sensor histidine kinase [Brevibacterium linens]KAB1947919.1 sensor histidine kinase [Brevibacterium linens ATCC 9172]SMX85657.1 Sensor histidine kinase regulating citrate/malate metabolism [Brevibacterium linens ATCC 9172]
MASLPAPLWRGRGRFRARRGGTLARRLFLVQLVLIVIVCTALSVTSYVTTLNNIREAAGERVLSIAETLAHDPFVTEAVTEDDPSARLQPFALTVIDFAEVDFVTIMDRDGTRYTHPDPDQLGKKYIGSTAKARAGQTETEEYVGTLGPSVRAIVPIKDAAGEVTAMVAVGVTLETLSVAQAASLPQIILVGLAALALGGLGSWLLARYLRRVTLGYGPEELRRPFAFYDSALHSLREGLILADDSGRLVLYNDEAASLLGLPTVEESTPLSLAEVALPESVRDLLATGRVAVDEIHFTEERVLVISQKQARQPRGGRDEGGTVATLRDRTDIQELTGELATMTTLSEALRAQTHEHANRLHTVSTLIELGRVQEALDFAVKDEQESQRLTDSFVASLDEPFITALMIGKAAQANERGIELTVTATGELPPERLDARDLVTVAGNLLDNAFDAVADTDEKHVWADFVAADGELIITIADSGAGVAGEDIDALFHLGASAKPEPGGVGRHGFGLVLVRQAVSRLGGHIDVDSDGGAIFTVTLPLGDTDGAGDYDSAREPTTDGEGASRDRAEGDSRER